MPPKADKGKITAGYTRKWEERKSISPDTAKPPNKVVRSTDEDDNHMASSTPPEIETTTEESNTSLKDIKGILDNIQGTIAKILHENGNSEKN